MAPHFLQSLRRKSSLMIRSASSDQVAQLKARPQVTETSKDTSESSSDSTPTNQSSSTTLSSLHGGDTPPPATTAATSFTVLPPPPPPPPAAASQPPAKAPLMRSATTNKRFSAVSGMSGLGNPTSMANLPTSPYAPRVLSYSEGIVAHKTMVIYGNVRDPVEKPVDGIVTISPVNDGFPPIRWPVYASHFKALLYLSPGANRFRLDFTSPKLSNSTSSNNIHSSYITVYHVPPTASPPLHLVILCGSDSPGTYDAVPARIEKEGNGIETAVRKFRMAAYLWQAYTAEQLHRHRLGRRAFRFEEEWTSGTANLRDQEMNIMRNEAKVHVVRSDKTTAELRSSDQDTLVNTTFETVRRHFSLRAGQKVHAAVMLLDSHWDSDSKRVTGHAAFGGSRDDISLAIFGSHTLAAYPTCFEDVVATFSDCTVTDAQVHPVGDGGESGSAWEACNVGIGGQLYEVGRMFGCPQQESGIMAGDYLNLNRTFVARESFATRNKSRGDVVLPTDECSFHRLDALRLSSHPMFAAPQQNPYRKRDFVHAWPVDGGNIVFTAPSGIQWLEMYTDGDSTCHHFIEYHGCRLVSLTEQELRSRLPDGVRKSKLRVVVFSSLGAMMDIEDFSTLSAKDTKLKLPTGQTAYRSNKIGRGSPEPVPVTDLIFDSVLQQTKLLTSIIIHHGQTIEGLEFNYEDSKSQLFGRTVGTTCSSEFLLDTRRGEHITGFEVRSGSTIDAIAIITSLGRVSPAFGNVKGGPSQKLIPPRGYTIAGIYGTSTAQVDSFGILITR